MKTLIALSVMSIATLALAGEKAPTPADGTTSVLATTATESTVATTTAVATTCGDCCETAKEVKLGPWQARRLARQADRQEARDCRDCCKGERSCKKQDCRPTAIVAVRGRRNCDCN